MLDLDLRFPHGSNIYKKLNDVEVMSDSEKQSMILEIAKRYLVWRQQALSVDSTDEETFVSDQTGLYEDYRDTLDDARVDIFDSRGALQPSALEEFCYFLFRPLVEGMATDVALGHHDVYQGLYFASRNFAEFSVLPVPQYPVGNIDFVIGKRLTSSIASATEVRQQVIYVPAVAVECKTYLDRPRWIESDVLATTIKRGFPRCLYIVISEFLKLDLSKVNVLGSQIDRVYVFRRTQNVDRKIRRAGERGLEPLHVPAMLDFFAAVKTHLHEDWTSPEDWTTTGILK